MRAGRRRASAAARVAGAMFVGAVVTGGLGCHFDRGELYESRGGGAGAGDTSSATEIPLLPAQPDMEARDACEACATEKCGDARDSCLEDDACTALLACKGMCDDPDCLRDCEAEHGFSPWYDDLWACVFGQCPAECQAGQNWGCVGEYAWRAPESPVVDVTVRFRTPAEWLVPILFLKDTFLVGAEVRSCLSFTESCEDPDDRGVVDATNSVTLAMSAFAGRVGSYLEIESDAHGVYGQRELFYGYPVARSTEIRVNYQSRGAFAEVVGWSQSAEGSSGALGANVADCLGSPARGVRVELPDLPGVEVWHFAGASLSPQNEETDLGSAFAPDLPQAMLAGQIAVRAIRTDGEDHVAEQQVWVRSGWITHVTLYPRPR